MPAQWTTLGILAPRPAQPEKMVADLLLEEGKEEMGWGEVGELGGGRRRRGEAGEGREAGRGRGGKKRAGET